MNKLSPTAAKIFPSGAVVVGDIINGYLVRRTYFGYSIREAMAAFRKEFANV
jgi:hypothetical protein